jgi:hypothetical protein
LPNDRLDCEKLPELLKPVDLAKLRACLAGINESSTVLYRLRREAAPSLELEREDATPPCLAATLPSIPVPREIVFQSLSPETGRISCYAAGIDVHADEILGVKVPSHKLELELDFPMMAYKIPKNDDETARLLASWALTPFWTASDGLTSLPSRVLTDALCKKCIGEKDLWKEGGQEPLEWP